MKSIAAGLFGLALIATPSHAQTTTNCNVFGNQILCNSNTSRGVGEVLVTPPSNPFDQIMRLQQLEQMRRQNEQLQLEQQRVLQEQELARAAQAQRQLELQRQAQREAEATNHTRIVGAAIAEGRCDAAMKQALEWGELDLAKQVLAICGTIGPKQVP